MAEFKQRITLEGADEVLRQLLQIGTTGARSFEQLQTAVQGNNAALAAISRTVNGTQQAVQNFGRSLVSLQAAVAPLSGSLGALLGVFGSFAGPAGLLAAAGGLTLFIRNLAETTDATRRQASALGLLPDQLIAIAKAVKPAGIGVEELATALTRFSQRAATEARGQFSALAQLATLLGQRLQAPGFQGGIVIQTVEDLQKLREAVGPAAQRLQALLQEIAKPGQRVPTVAELRTQLELAARGTDETAQKYRDLIRELGIPIPAQTAPEALSNLVKDLEPTLTGLGIQLRDDRNQAIDTFEAFLRLADKLKSMPDGFQKTAIAASLLSRGFGPELVEALKGGRENIEAIRAALTGVEERMETARQLRLRFQEIDDASKRAGNSILTAFGPALTRILDSVATDVDNLRKVFAGEFRLNIQAPTGFLQSVDSFVNPLKILLRGINAAQFLFDASGLQAAAQPFLAAARAAFESIRNGLAGVGTAIADIFTTLGSDASEAWQTISNAAQAAFNFIRGLFTGESWGVIWEGLKSAAQAAFDFVVNLFAGLPGAIAGALGSLTNVLTAPFQSALSIIQGIFNRIMEFVRSIGSGLSDAVSGGGGGGGGGEGFASGGFVRGPGTGTSDSILAQFGRGLIRVSNGEFIVRADAVRELMRQYGAGIMWAINRGELPLPKLSMGGFVERVNASLNALALPRFASGGGLLDDMALASGGSQVFLSFNGGQSVGPFTGSEDAIRALTKAAVSSNMFSAQRRQSSVR